MGFLFVVTFFSSVKIDMIRICCLVFLTLSATIQAIDVLLMGAMSVCMSIKRLRGDLEIYIQNMGIYYFIVSRQLIAFSRVLYINNIVTNK